MMIRRGYVMLLGGGGRHPSRHRRCRANRAPRAAAAGRRAEAVVRPYDPPDGVFVAQDGTPHHLAEFRATAWW